MQSEAFFLPVEPPGLGQRFCLYHPAVVGPPRGLVLYIHPFAEEMNKSRRMAALQSRALAQAGFAVLQIDLLGCGDSSGDFGDSTWNSWVSDVVLAAQWLRRRHEAENTTSNQPPLWLWGLRAGCLLAVAAANQLTKPCNFLFWQPPGSGKQLLQQFLRLKVAGDMLGGQSKGLMELMRQQLAAGSSVEIAGYMVSAGLATGLDQASLAPPPKGTAPQRVEWFELSTRDDASLSPASTQSIARWQTEGFEVHSNIVAGSAFWQTTEIEEAPALIDATTTAIGSMQVVPA